MSEAPADAPDPPPAAPTTRRILGRLTLLWGLVGIAAAAASLFFVLVGIALSKEYGTDGGLTFLPYPVVPALIAAVALVVLVRPARRLARGAPPLSGRALRVFAMVSAAGSIVLFGLVAVLLVPFIVYPGDARFLALVFLVPGCAAALWGLVLSLRLRESAREPRAGGAP